MSTAASQGQRGLDLFLRPTAFWLWCLPGCAAIAAAVLEGNHRLSLTTTGIIWTLATLWIGVGCAWNALRCGRIHCIIHGTMLPLLALVGILNVMGVLAISWNIYWAAFGAILIAGFIPEILGKRHYI